MSAKIVANLPMTVMVTDQMHQSAKEKESAVMGSDTVTTTKNKTVVEAAERYYVGFLGEDAFEEILMLHQKHYTKHQRIDGSPDGGKDFTCVDNLGEEVRIDVKTGGRERYREIMMPERSYQEYSAEVDVYVGALLDRAVDFDVPRSVSFYGFGTADDAATWRVKTLRGKTRYEMLGSLRDMHTLMRFLA